MTTTTMPTYSLVIDYADPYGDNEPELWTTIDHDTGEIVDIETALAEIDTRYQALALLSNPIDALRERDKGLLMKEALKRAGASIAVQNAAAKYTVVCEHTAAKLFVELPKQLPGQYQQRDHLDPVESISDLGISKGQAARLRAVAALTNEKIKEYLESYDKENREITLATLRRLAKAAKKEIEKQERINAPLPEIPQICTIEQNDTTTHIASSSIDLILTDPPYGISAYAGVTKINGEIVNSDFDGSDEWDSADPDAFLETMEVWVQEWGRLLKPGAAVIAFTDRILISDLWRLLKKYDLTPKNIITWVKTNPSPASFARRNLMSATEFLVWAVKPGATYVFNEVDGWDRRNALVTPITSQSEKVDHPTQKPLSVLTPLIELTTNPGDLILDPFAGSGSTGVAALRLKRTAHLIERDPNYVALAYERVSKENITE